MKFNLFLNQPTASWLVGFAVAWCCSFDFRANGAAAADALRLCVREAVRQVLPLRRGTGVAGEGLPGKLCSFGCCCCLLQRTASANVATTAAAAAAAADAAAAASAAAAAAYPPVWWCPKLRQLSSFYTTNFSLKLPHVVWSVAWS